MKGKPSKEQLATHGKKSLDLHSHAHKLGSGNKKKEVMVGKKK
jgi:hypothetical protein